MKKMIFLLLIGIIATIPLSAQRFYEFTMRGHADTFNFVAVTSDPATISLVQSQLNLPEDQRTMHINGTIAAGNGGFNRNWSWHFVPDEWTLADFSVEVCDGNPQMIEDELSYWLDTVGYFCPWSSYVLRELENNGIREETSRIQIYPNPAKDHAYISLPEFTISDGEVRVFDILGSEVANYVSESNSGSNLIRIDFNALPSGIYNVVLKYGNITTTQRIYVQK